MPTFENKSGQMAKKSGLFCDFLVFFIIFEILKNGQKWQKAHFWPKKVGKWPLLKIKVGREFTRK